MSIHVGQAVEFDCDIGPTTTRDLSTVTGGTLKIQLPDLTVLSVPCTVVAATPTVVRLKSTPIVPTIAQIGMWAFYFVLSDNNQSLRAAVSVGSEFSRP